MLDDEVLVKAIETFGSQRQMDVLIEEMSELTKEIIKARRNAYPEERQPITDKMMEEFVDVTISLDQLCMMLILAHGNNRDVFDAAYSAIRRKKMNRLLRKIREAEKINENC